MSHTVTAEELFHEVRALPQSERSRFFSLLGEQAFEQENFSHEAVFGHLRHTNFTAQEAAEYLEISLPTFRRYVQSERILPVETVGRNQLFSTQDLRALKKRRS